MPLMRGYNHFDNLNYTITAIPQFGGSPAHLSTFLNEYHFYSASYDTNGRFIHKTPSGCSISHRMNMTIDNPEDCEYLSLRNSKTVSKKKRSRMRLALKELLGRSARSSGRDLFRHYSSREKEYRSESPRNRHHSVAVACNSAGISSKDNVCCTTSTSEVVFCADEPRFQRRRHYQIKDNFVVQNLGVLEPKGVDFSGRLAIKRSKDAFVNSHEWTLSRSVSELRLLQGSNGVKSLKDIYHKIRLPIIILECPVKH
ncbi:hypothetical protein NECAME_05979 [Necator americanus]|uniref:Uncharacterized protein n=1 Tax=Necator americanus TaxID=51031 RepID=W2TXH0_NECAM|nr:hypothetical protein NECAME_05979 [Necator americanus]ETN86364.1 hypothetical protein NECAME_05979 [Necator americanus]